MFSFQVAHHDHDKIHQWDFRESNPVIFLSLDFEEIKKIFCLCFPTATSSPSDAADMALAKSDTTIHVPGP